MPGAPPSSARHCTKWLRRTVPSTLGLGLPKQVRYKHVNGGAIAILTNTYKYGQLDIIYYSSN